MSEPGQSACSTRVRVFFVREVVTMLYWFLVASVVAAIVGALGVGMSATAVGITPVLAALIGSFIVISLFTGVLRRVVR